MGQPQNIHAKLLKPDPAINRDPKQQQNPELLTLQNILILKKSNP
jgi:hypothetical protein